MMSSFVYMLIAKLNYMGSQHSVVIEQVKSGHMSHFRVPVKKKALAACAVR